MYRDILVYQHVSAHVGIYPGLVQKSIHRVAITLACVHISISKCNSKRQAAHVWSGRCASPLAQNTILDAKTLMCGVALIVDFA